MLDAIPTTKHLLIPGFMDSPTWYAPLEAVNLWAGENPLPQLRAADIAIGHSLGANWLAAQANEYDARVIMVNPIIPSPGFLPMVPRWLKYLGCEGLGIGHNIGPRYLGQSLRLAYELLQRDALADVLRLSPTRVTIIRGELDNHMFSSYQAAKLESMGFSVTTLPDCWHNWSTFFLLELQQKLAYKHGNPQDAFDSGNPRAL